LARARAIATRCRSPPDSLVGGLAAMAVEADGGEQGAGAPLEAGQAGAEDANFGVLDRGQLREQIVQLEDQTDVATAVAGRSDSRARSVPPTRMLPEVAADTSGRVSAEFTVSKGPFGANNIVCRPAQACLISVTQATPSPTHEADVPISFG
jgi:hypothetical protein